MFSHLLFIALFLTRIHYNVNLVEEKAVRKFREQNCKKLMSLGLTVKPLLCNVFNKNFFFHYILQLE